MIFQQNIFFNFVSYRAYLTSVMLKIRAHSFRLIGAWTLEDELHTAV